jgi:AraC family transcriptional regulator
MTLMARVIASGAGWQASDVRCSAGPTDPPFEERHDRICLAVTLNGTFDYRSSRGAATLAPGATLLGNPGDCFECGHQHSTGDRCLSFHFEPEFYESVLSDIPGRRRLSFDRPSVPPQTSASWLLPRADAALSDPSAAEEFAFDLAAFAATALTEPGRSPRAAAANGRRIQELARWIEAEAENHLPLMSLAQRACMSPHHFLREFRRVIGITPHQFLLSLRLRRAAQRLRDSDDPVLKVALDSGFSDLSEFNRRFRRVLGVTPSAYRAKHGGALSD